MAYTFELGKSVQENVRHIAETQVDKAISEIDHSDLSTSATVHQIRKRCKKVRGLRPVRDVGPDQWATSIPAPDCTMSD